MNSQIQIMFQKALQDFQLGHLKKAEEMLSHCAQLEAKNFDVLHLLAIVYASQEKHQAAIECYKKALVLSPNDASALSNLGSSLNSIGHNQQAFSVFQKAIKIDPKAPIAWYNAANILSDIGEYKEALTYYRRSIKLNPQYFQAYINYGKVLFELKRFSESLTYYDKALRINQDSVECLINKGATLNELKRYGEAIAHYDKALSLKPEYAEAWSNKGNTLNELKRYDEAIAHYDKALSLKPDIDWVSGDLLHTKMKICSWSGFSDSLDNISKKVMEGEKVVNPFALLALNDDALLHKKSSEIYIQDKYQYDPVLGPIPKRPKRDKIRIGYFSADFKNHAVAFLIAELIEIHDRSRFEIYAFSLVMTSDEMRARLNGAFDHFFHVEGMSDIAIAQRARDLTVDIAVDLSGFTGGSRTGIFSYRAAPIQVNYLGYPGTLSSNYIDYIIADRTLIPLESRSCYSEKVVYLPNSYQVNDRKRAIAEKQFTRQEIGQPEDGFVFCCFNNNFKILPATFASWMRILKAVEGSTLWLFKDNPWVVDGLKKEASNHGIDKSRLIFTERLPLPEHLARHRQADLFLDTFPYNAHTTASDALWAGLPILTLMGRSFASRVAASLLNAIGLPELITNAQEEYEALAIELATNPKKLADIKLKLANNRLTAPLFDTPIFTKNIEAAYIDMQRRLHAGLEPEHISIA